jgi:hypothetical protein
MIELVQQDSFPDACQQSVIAMLAGCPLQEVIALVGAKRLSYTERSRATDAFLITLSKHGYLVDAYGERALGALEREHRTLWLSVSDYLNPNFGHAVLLSFGKLFDSEAGVDPVWPWSRYVSQAVPVIEAPALP